MKLWFATIDGNMIDIFNTENEAKEWQQSNTGNVCFVTEVE
ncbi:hypothetical protein [Pasteurella multocida]|nr:hypothetical protein [Pasteurella multocida]